MLFNFFQKEKGKKLFNYIPLEKSIKYFGSSYLYIKDFIIYIRKSPNIMKKIIKYAEKKDLDDSFIYFISNNFYNDIFINDEISEDFLILFENLLAEEINNLNNIEDFGKILNESNCFTLLNGLNYNNYIKKYFDYVLSDIILKYENSGNYKNKLIFIINDLYFNNLNEDNNDKNNIKKEKEPFESSENNHINISKTFNYINYNDLIYEEIINYNDFTKEHLIDLSKKKLRAIMEKYKNDENMKLYINDKINLAEKKNKIFSFSVFLDELKKYKEYNTILDNYIISFNIVTAIINDIINKILDTSDFIPFLIKHVCKIIYNLLKKKFNNEGSEFKIFKYIFKLFFMKIFQFYFLYPDSNLFLETIIISQETKNNLLIIFNIFKKIISGELYENDPIYGNYIPFNLFFINNTPKLFKIYEKILDIDLQKTSIKQKTSIIDSKSITSYSICLNVNDLTTLLNIIKHNKEKFFSNKKENNMDFEEEKELEIIYNKIKTNKDIFKSLKERDSNSLNYYIFYENYYSKEISNTIFYSINSISKNFKILENSNNSKNYEEIHTKNLLSDIFFSVDLFNLKKISNDIDLDDFKEILLKLSNYYSLLNSISLNNLKTIEMKDEYEEGEEDNINCLNNKDNKNTNIPIEWYINSLISYLGKLNEDFKQNNYEKIFIDLIEQINSSIKKYNFENLSKFLEKLKSINKYLKDYSSFQKVYKELDLNSQINHFIKNENIEVKIKYKYNNKEKIFKIKNKNIKNKSIFGNIFRNKSKKLNSIKCCSIYEFCENFPNLALEQKRENIFCKIEEEISLQPGISSYFNIIKEFVDEKFSKNDKKVINLKIKKFIYKSIYYKLWPKEISKEDIIFHSKLISLNSNEPNNLNKEFQFDKVLPLINNIFENLNSEYCPNEKLKLIEQIFKIINNNFIEKKGDNNEYIKDICQYIIIKSNPERLISNLKYIQMFVENDDKNNYKYFNIMKICVNDLQRNFNDNDKVRNIS